MNAVIIQERGLAALVDIKEQTIQPDYFKLKVVALAVNPTDFHHTAGAGRVGGILGCDLSGIVEDVGRECRSNISRGDAVYGVCHGANISSDEEGAFAEYALVRDGHISKIPGHMTFEETATLGVNITTIGQTLYMTLNLPFQDEDALASSPFSFIYGGSTATGTLAIQFAKLYV